MSDITAIPYRTPACDKHLPDNDSDECPWCEIESLQTRIAELERPGFHHPDCNWWKWDWRYSWDETDCTCEAVAGPPEPPKEEPSDG